MKIEFSTDHNISGSESLSAPIIAQIERELSRFSSNLSRVEVHLADENGPKDGQNDKRCTLEARPKGLKPIAVTNHANTIGQAVDGALEQLSASLETIFGRSKRH